MSTSGGAAGAVSCAAPCLYNSSAQYTHAICSTRAGRTQAVHTQQPQQQQSQSRACEQQLRAAHMRACACALTPLPPWCALLLCRSGGVVCVLVRAPSCVVQRCNEEAATRKQREPKQMTV